MFELCWAYVSVITRKIPWQLESKLLVVMEVFQNDHFYNVIFWSTLHISMQKSKAIFFLHIFCVFRAFLLFVTILARDHIELCFYFKNAYLKEHIGAFEKILPFGHRVILPVLSIASVEKIWTLVNYISWCLICHMTIWIKFVSTKYGFSEYLLSAMWSFGQQCIFQWENARKLHFLWFGGIISSSTNEITCSFLIFSLHLHT